MTKWSVKLVEQNTPAYEQALALARLVYKNHYNAVLQNLPPSYFVYQEHNEEQLTVKACMSCTPIQNGNKLFSERYLELPVEQYLATPVPREKVVEIGSFSSMGDTFSTWNLMRSAIFWGYIVNKWTYALVTITPQVESMLKRCQMEFVQIGQATPDKLNPDEQQLWGNYYEQSPTVCLIDIQASLFNNIPSLANQSEMALEISGVRA